MYGQEAYKIPPSEIDKSNMEALARRTAESDRKLSPEEYSPERLQAVEDLQSVATLESPLSPDQNVNKVILMKIEKGLEGVYKPTSGETEDDKYERNITQGTAFVREWLNHRVELALELGLVPPTVIRSGNEGVGSVQEFIPNIDTAWSKLSNKYFDAKDKLLESNPDLKEEEIKTAELLWNIAKEEINNESLIALAVHDFLTENSDRNINNFCTDEDGHVIAIDNALSFSETPETWLDGDQQIAEGMYGVGHKSMLFKIFGGQEVPQDVLGKLEWFNSTPQRQEDLKEAMILGLGQEIGERKWNDFQARLTYLLETKKVPTSMYGMVK